MLKPLKLVIVSQQVRRNDGQGRVNYEIVRSALDAGWHVTVIAVHCASDLQSHPRFEWVPFNFEKWPTQLMRNFAFGIASSRWLRANRSQIDVLHANGGVTQVSADVNAAHFVHRAWARNPFYPYRRWWSSPYAAYQYAFTLAGAGGELPAFKCAQYVVAVSGKIASELEIIGVSKSKISVIHNGVDTNEFHPGRPERDRFSLPTEVPLFLFAGDIRTSRKNLGTVLSALVQVEGLHLAVAGSSDGSPFPALAEKLNLSSRVHFLGMVREMPALMRSVDAFVFPSRYEPMGLVLLEALASGLPIVTAETAGGAEIVGAAGFVLSNPNDVDGLAMFMRELAASSSLRSRMGEQGRAIALGHNWSRMAENYLRLFRQVKDARLSEYTERSLA